MATEAALLRAAAGRGRPGPRGGGDRRRGPRRPPSAGSGGLDGGRARRRARRSPARSCGTTQYAAARPVLAGQCGEALARIHRIAAGRRARAGAAATRSRSSGPRSTPSASPTRPSSWGSAGSDAPPARGRRHASRGRPRRLPQRQPRSSGPTGCGRCSTGSWPTAATRSRTWAGCACGPGGSGPSPGSAGSATVDDLVGGLRGRRRARSSTATRCTGGRCWARSSGGSSAWCRPRTHLTGVVRSVELAAIGRRVCEVEHDLLLLLPEGDEPAWRRPAEPRPRCPRRDRDPRCTTRRPRPSWWRPCASSWRAT